MKDKGDLWTEGKDVEELQFMAPHPDDTWPCYGCHVIREMINVGWSDDIFERSIRQEVSL